MGDGLAFARVLRPVSSIEQPSLDGYKGIVVIANTWALAVLSTWNQGAPDEGPCAWLKQITRWKMLVPFRPTPSV